MRKLQTLGETAANNLSIKCIIHLLIVATLLLLLNGCTSSSPLTSWKDSNQSHASLNKILVIGVVHDSLIGVRRSIEEYFVLSLKAMGYNAEASVETFGKEGFSRLEQEKAYVKLCNKGVDAILAIALLDKKKAGKHHEPQTRKNVGTYYYRRVLSYHAIGAGPYKPIDHTNQIQFIWEVTLFNLSTLAPLYWAQTKPAAPTSIIQNHKTYSKIFLSNLQKHKVLNKRSLVKR